MDYEKNPKLSRVVMIEKIKGEIWHYFPHMPRYLRTSAAPPSAVLTVDMFDSYLLVRAMRTCDPK